MKCEICGQEFEKPAWLPPFDCVCDSDECFTTKLWNIKYDNICKNPHSFAIIDGHCYFIGDEDKSIHIRGFGGRQFKIRFNDGTEITTTNLWDNGDVPNSFKNRLHNNAKFIDDGVSSYKEITLNNASLVVENLEKQGDNFDKDFLTMIPKY